MDLLTSAGCKLMTMRQNISEESMEVSSDDHRIHKFFSICVLTRDFGHFAGNRDGQR